MRVIGGSVRRLLYLPLRFLLPSSGGDGVRGGLVDGVWGEVQEMLVRLYPNR